MGKTALITGITGQDGSFLAEFLLEKGYDVHGIIRRSSSFNTGRIEHLYLDEWVRDMKNKRLLTLHYGDMTDSSSLVRIIQQVQPNEIYNLAAQSHVKVSFDCPEYTAEADAVGTLRLLEAVRILGLEKKVQNLSSLHFRAFWPRARSAAKRDHAVLSALALRRGQAIRLLDCEKLPRKLWYVRRQWHFVQSRERKTGRNLCHTQDYIGRSAN